MQRPLSNSRFQAGQPPFCQKESFKGSILKVLCPPLFFCASINSKMQFKGTKKGRSRFSILFQGLKKKLPNRIILLSIFEYTSKFTVYVQLHYQEQDKRDTACPRKLDKFYSTIRLMKMERTSWTYPLLCIYETNPALVSRFNLTDFLLTR